ncbi:MAG: LacI family DNA-binding transcriptional regulator [Clostridia bacterium]
MTIKEIAQLCGVSRGTVDRVINRRGRVKPETEALILRTLKSEGYTKNIVGRALTVRRSAPVIGVILCSEGNPFFDDVLVGIRRAEAELHDYGVTLLLRTMRGYRVERQLELIGELEEQLAALVIQPISAPAVEARLRELMGRGVPTVAVNTDIEASCRCCYVGSDYEAGGETAAGLMRLITQGRGTVGVVTGVDTLMSHALRLKGFESSLHALCPELAIVDWESGMDDAEQAYRAARNILTRHPTIDAMFVVAAGACDVCRAVIDAGREGTVSVVAYDDVPSTREMIRRGVIKAVVCQQPLEQGYRAVKAAFEMILSGEMTCNERIIMENQIKIMENLR